MLASSTAAADAGPPGLALADLTLSSHSRRLNVPEYDRRNLVPAVVHLGLGGFHRAHQAVYLDDLARGGETGWGVIGVSLRRPDMKRALDPQDCLFTVVERDAEGDAARVVGSVIRSLSAPEDPDAVLAALADPRTRLVTLTITANGYGVDRVNGTWAPDPAVVADELSHPNRPVTAYGYIVEALARRRAAGLRAFTVLSCDNVPRNGEAARTAVVSFARLRDPSLASWIERRVSFPSSMVDRITPSTSQADREFVAGRFGVEDRWPVVTETFSQWIVEDSFGNGRPPLEDVGVQFVPDVEPYKLIKSRLLNGSHSAMACLGVLAGHTTTAQVMADPVFASFVETLMREEIGPLLPSVPGIDLEDYEDTLLARLGNPKVADTLARLCARGSTKLPSYLLPSVTEALEEGGRYQLMALAVAGWMRHLRGFDGQGRTFGVEDPLKDTLQPLARALGTDPGPLLELRAIFGDLWREPDFCDALEQALCDLDRYGARETVSRYLGAGVALAA